MNPVPAPAAANSRCAGCGTEFRCGMEAGDPVCWCTSLSPLMPLPHAPEPASTAAGCFCPACLAARLAAVAEPAER